jgi:hypothetical protein
MLTIYPDSPTLGAFLTFQAELGQVSVVHFFRLWMGVDLSSPKPLAV